MRFVPTTLAALTLAAGLPLLAEPCAQAATPTPTALLPYCRVIEAPEPHPGNLFIFVQASTPTSQIQSTLALQRAYLITLAAAVKVAPTSTLQNSATSAESALTNLMTTENTILTLRTTHAPSTKLANAYAAFSITYGTTGSAVQAASLVCAPFALLKTDALGLGDQAVFLAQSAGPGKNPNNFVAAALKSPSLPTTLTATKAGTQSWTIAQAKGNPGVYVCLSVPTSQTLSAVSATFGACA